MSIRLVFESAKDFLDTTVFAWFVQPYQLFSAAQYSDWDDALLIAAIVGALVFSYTFLFRRWWGADYDEAKTPKLTKDFIWMGALVILCAVAPVIVSGRQVELIDAYKSYGLHPIPGVVLFVAGLVLMLQPRFRQWGLLALIGIAVTTQILNADNWGRYWDYQRSNVVAAHLARSRYPGRHVDDVL